MIRRGPARSLLFFALLVLNLSGCSRVEMGYDWANFMVKWKVGKFLKLDRRNKKDFHAVVDSYHRWHRKTMLPRYAETARDMARITRSRKNLAGDLDKTINKSLDLFVESLDPAVGSAARTLTILDAKGIAHLERVMEKGNKRHRKRYTARPGKAFKRRLKRSIKNVESFTGRLSRAQRARMRALVEKYPWEPEAWLEGRRDNQQKLLKFLRGKEGRAAVESHLRAWWFRHGQDAEKRRRNKEKVRNYLLDLRGILTEKQIQKAARKLDDYAAKFDKMALKYAGKR